MVLSLLCHFGRHTPKRSHMKWDGTHFISDCRFCKSPIRKAGHSSWQKIEGEDQALASR